MKPEVPIEKLKARAFTLPTDKPEADGTLAWDSTTVVVVEVAAANNVGTGYTYTDASITRLITGKLAETVVNLDAMQPHAAWQAMQRAVRNLGREGLVATAISAIDCALYDLKARLLHLPLASMLGACRDTVPIYGSGGFTSYTDDELRSQLEGWVAREGCAFVKMKIGTDPKDDPRRVAVAKKAIGAATLFVDANGAYTAKQALALAARFADQEVGWFEEPVSSDDLAGLCFVRDRAPAGMDVAAGEYGYSLDYFRRMLAGPAIDVMQADITRCGGLTAFLQIAGLCEAHHIDLSGHCAPSMHVQAACAAPRLRHLEWFHDHVRIEQMLFDGAPIAKGGVLRIDNSRPGNGLTFKHQDAMRYAA
ncbi:MAG TPA: enolase C-terminal domain-like protein [Xanthobacteraceae bacterium]|nr:enolase C-terminal domain-like protein [Xanthobacteraceae bacterium]